MKTAKEGDILSTTAQTHQQDLERLKSLRYIDDDFMTVCLADNYEGIELVLRIILGREDITIKTVRTQELLKNLQGRSAILDVHAIDSTKKEFDVDYSDFRFIPINLSKDHFHETSIQVCRNNYSNNLAQAGR